MEIERSDTIKGSTKGPDYPCRKEGAKRRWLVRDKKVKSVDDTKNRLSHKKDQSLGLCNLDGLFCLGHVWIKASIMNRLRPKEGGLDSWDDRNPDWSHRSSKQWAIQTPKRRGADLDFPRRGIDDHERTRNGVGFRRYTALLSYTRSKSSCSRVSGRLDVRDGWNQRLVIRVWRWMISWGYRRVKAIRDKMELKCPFLVPRYTHLTTNWVCNPFVAKCGYVSTVTVRDGA